MIQNIKGNACAGDHVHNCSVKCHLRTTMNPVHFEFLLKAGQGRLHQLRFTSVDFSFFFFRSCQISLLLHVIQLFPCRPGRSTFTGDTCFTKVANGRTLILLLFQTREGAIVATLPQWSWSISSLFKQPILNLIETGCLVDRGKCQALTPDTDTVCSLIQPLCNTVYTSSKGLDEPTRWWGCGGAG